MDPRDRPRPLLDGASCTACGASVPTDAIRILAQRDDVAFVELDCPSCHSTTLALLIDPVDRDGTSTLDVADDAADGRIRPVKSIAGPITEKDVEALRRDLAAWDGDLVGWLEALDGGDRRGSAVDR
jgi:hypothetical protein